MGVLEHDLAWEALVLCTWWSLWTLADSYLIVFTPWSELSVLLACALSFFFARVRRARRVPCRQSGGEAQDAPLKGAERV